MIRMLLSLLLGVGLGLVAIWVVNSFPSPKREARKYLGMVEPPVRRSLYERTQRWRS